MASDSDVPTFMGIPMKMVSLVTLTFQNSALILIMHYSRVMPSPSGHRFLASTAVLLNELIKLTVCFCIAFGQRRATNGSMSPLSLTARHVFQEVFQKDHWKLAIPAMLYVIQNRLQYLAVSNLDAATFQVTYQLKILTTALFSVTMLRRRLNATQWTALVLLTIGIAVVQLPGGSSAAAGAASGGKHSRRSGTYDGVREDEAAIAGDSHGHTEMNNSVGLVAVIIACMLSGLSGVYFEKVLKGSQTTLWVRNIQLAFYSLFPAVFAVAAMDGKTIMERGFFDGYNSVVWTTVIFQASGGIIVALCVKFADNILKNFATSISILISFVASVYFFNFEVTFNFLLGASLVIFATYLYGKGENASSSKAQYVPLQNNREAEAEDRDLELGGRNPGGHDRKA